MKKQLVGKPYIVALMEESAGRALSDDVIEHRISRREFPLPFYNRVERKRLGIQQRLWKKAHVDAHFAVFPYPCERKLTSRG